MKTINSILIILLLTLNHFSYSQTLYSSDTSALDYLYDTELNNSSSELRKHDRRIEKDKSLENLGLKVSSNTNVSLNDYNNLPQPNKNPLNDYENKDDNEVAFKSFREAFEKPSVGYMSQPISQDPVKTNMDRFYKSPCYHELGFNPYADPEQQELKYKRCEEEKKKKNTSIAISQSYNGLVTVVGVFVFVLILFVTGYYILNYINSNPNLELKNVLKAITIGGLIFIGLVMLKFLNFI